MLDCALREGHVEIARSLIDKGADVNGPPDGFGYYYYGEAPLHVVARWGEAEMLCLNGAAVDVGAEMVRLLCLNGAAVDVKNGKGESPLLEAARRDHLATAQALLAAGADVNLRNIDGVSVLECAVQESHPKIARVLVEYGVDVDAVNRRGRTALHLASTLNNGEMVDVLVEAGASTDLPFVSGRSALHIAAGQRSIPAVLALLKHGASVHLRDADGGTPLHVAAAMAGTVGAAEVVDILLRQGADETINNDNGQIAADVLGSGVGLIFTLPRDVERARKLLEKASADRAWRRRGFLVMCRAHYPGGRVRLGQGEGEADAGMAEGTRSSAARSREYYFADWAAVAGMLMGAGADPISLMGNGAGLIFETIVGFL